MTSRAKLTSLVDKATKCLATAEDYRRNKKNSTIIIMANTQPLTSLAVSSSHCLAEVALVMVSRVVNVCRNMNTVVVVNSSSRAREGEERKGE